MRNATAAGSWAQSTLPVMVTVIDALVVSTLVGTMNSRSRGCAASFTSSFASATVPGEAGSSRVKSLAAPRAPAASTVLMAGVPPAVDPRMVYTSLGPWPAMAAWVQPVWALTPMARSAGTCERLVTYRLLVLLVPLATAPVDGMTVFRSTLARVHVRAAVTLVPLVHSMRTVESMLTVMFTAREVFAATAAKTPLAGRASAAQQRRRGSRLMTVLLGVVVGCMGGFLVSSGWR